MILNFSRYRKFAEGGDTYPPEVEKLIQEAMARGLKREEINVETYKDPNTGVTVYEVEGKRVVPESESMSTEDIVYKPDKEEAMRGAKLDRECEKKGAFKLLDPLMKDYETLQDSLEKGLIIMEKLNGIETYFRPEEPLCRRRFEGKKTPPDAIQYKARFEQKPQDCLTISGRLPVLRVEVNYVEPATGKTTTNINYIQGNIPNNTICSADDISLGRAAIQSGEMRPGSYIPVVINTENVEDLESIGALVRNNKQQLIEALLFEIDPDMKLLPKGDQVQDKGRDFRGTPVKTSYNLGGMLHQYRKYKKGGKAKLGGKSANMKSEKDKFKKESFDYMGKGGLKKKIVFKNKKSKYQVGGEMEDPCLETYTTLSNMTRSAAGFRSAIATGEVKIGMKDEEYGQVFAAWFPSEPDCYIEVPENVKKMIDPVTMNMDNERASNPLSMLPINEVAQESFLHGGKFLG